MWCTFQVDPNSSFIHRGAYIAYMVKLLLLLHCALAAAQCIVIGPVCGCGCGLVGVCVCEWVGLLPR